MAETQELHQYTKDQLQQNTSLWYKVHVFMYDLRHFREKVDSQARLDSVVDASYLGMPYFQDQEVDYLKCTLIDEIPLQQIIQDVLDERLERRQKKRAESGDFRVCAAHDLAPIFEKVFDVKPKELATNKEFQQLLETHGLDLPETTVIRGLTKARTFSNQKRKRKNHKK